MAGFQIRERCDDDGGWVGELLKERWGSTKIVSKGRIYDADRLPGFVAEGDGGYLGLVTYCIDGDECEVVSLDSCAEGRGIGTGLLSRVEEAARAGGCKRLWLATTNDNLKALRFYQKWGLTISVVRCNVLEAYRKLKPQIPLVGFDGIEIRDEIELEKILQGV
ncbi:MAG: GNAT family N-acetyltransferase [Planctomycetota bacterium]|jgi:DNA-3-methyladenine glycosylase I